MIDTLLQDLRYALRTLAKSPGFTLGVVLTLALGIGANVTMFSVVDRMLFRPPPLLHDPSATHRVYLTWMHRGEQVLDGGVQYARYVDLTNWATSLSRTALFTEEDLAIGVGTEAREMRVAMVSASFFGFFDAPPALGRYFTAAEDTPPNGTAVAVLAYAFWQTRYGGRPEALGSTLQIGPTVYTIIGVAPKGFVGLWQVQRPVAFIPITGYGSAMAAGMDRSWWRNYGWTWASMLVQRKPTVSVAAATADLTNAYLKSYAAEEATNPGTTPAALVRPRAVVASVLSERGPNQSSIAKVASWIAGVAVIVLLIACANVANLLLSRVLRRKREMAVRLALGISRVRLVSQLFTECVLLALVGGAAGLLVAEWGGAVLRAQFLARGSEVGVLGDGRTLWFAGAAALVAALLTGLAPAILSQRNDVAGDLKAGAREGTFQRSRVRVALLLVQAALSVVLLVGAGLFVRSLRHVQQLPLGYDADPVLVVDLNMRGVRLDSAQQVALRRTLLDAAQAIPGVVHASPRVAVPFWGSYSVSLYVAGVDSVRRHGRFDFNAVGGDYFATMGTRVLRGRSISDHDVQGAPRVMVVSEAMAKALWPGREAIGQCVRVRFETAPCTYVVGIAENIKAEQLGDDPTFYYYLSWAQWAPGNGGLFLRMAGPAARSTEMVRRRLQQVMPGAAYVTVTPLREILGERTRSWQLGATMFLAFGALALALAAIGLYSVMAYNVSQRTQELGVRAALGAQRRDLVRLVVNEGVSLGAAGIAIGVVIALAGGPWLGPLLFQESPHDPLVFGFVTVMLLGVTALASFVPSRRAARVDPMVALRYE